MTKQMGYSPKTGMVHYVHVVNGRRIPACSRKSTQTELILKETFSTLVQEKLFAQVSCAKCKQLH